MPDDSHIEVSLIKIRVPVHHANQVLPQILSGEGAAEPANNRSHDPYLLQTPATPQGFLPPAPAYDTTAAPVTGWGDSLQQPPLPTQYTPDPWMSPPRRRTFRIPRLAIVFFLGTLAVGSLAFFFRQPIAINMQVLQDQLPLKEKTP